MDPAEKFNRTHAIYRNRRLAWDYNDTHAEADGGRSLLEHPEISTWLPQFGVEADDAYEARKLRANGLYDNLGKLAVKVHQAYLFKNAPQRNNVPKRIDYLLSDVDGRGNSADTFFKMVDAKSRIRGIHFVLVDATAIPGSITKAQEKALGYRTWFESIDAMQVIDWGTSASGGSVSLDYAVVKDFLTRGGPFEEKSVIERWRVFLRDEIVIYERDASHKDDPPLETSRVKNSIGRVPLIAFYEEKVGEMDGRTFVDDVSVIANKIWEYNSVDDEGIYWSGFDLLVVSSDRETSEIKLGEARALDVGAEGSAEFITGGKTAGERIYTKVEKLQQRALAMIFNQIERHVDSAQVQAAEKTRYDRAGFITALRWKAMTMEQGEVGCFKLALEYHGESMTNVEDMVVYFKDFEVGEDSPDVWEARFRHGVSEPADWLQQRNPGISIESAREKVQANLSEVAKEIPNVDPFGSSNA